jgi:hypothetical protein
MHRCGLNASQRTPAAPFRALNKADMTRQDVVLVEKLWNRLIGPRFEPREFLQWIRKHGGHDMKDLSDDDLMRLFEGRFTGDWNEPAFSFSELLAFYSVRDENRPKEEVVGWVFCSFVIADAIKQGATDWEMQFDKFISCYVEIRSHLETEEAIQVFQRVFHDDNVLEQSRST